MILNTLVHPTINCIILFSEESLTFSPSSNLLQAIMHGFDTARSGNYIKSGVAASGQYPNVGTTCLTGVFAGSSVLAATGARALSNFDSRGNGSLCAAWGVREEDEEEFDGDDDDEDDEDDFDDDDLDDEAFLDDEDDEDFDGDDDEIETDDDDQKL